MADNAGVPGLQNLMTRVEVAVPPAFALQAAHVLGQEPFSGGGEEEPGRARLGQRTVALAVIVLLVLAGLLAALQGLHGGR